MTIIPLPAFNDNYIWAIVNEAKHSFSCVDPGDATNVLIYAKNNGLILNNILLTHHHVDHTGGVYDLLEAFPDAIVYGPIDDRIPLVNRKVRDEDLIHIDTLDFRVLNTPGHTSSHICYQEITKGLLFCGDTLFSAGCGRVFDGTMEQLHHSILLLKDLPEDTRVYCGHEYTQHNLQFAASIEPDNPTIHAYASFIKEKQVTCTLPSTLSLEREINPFMRTHLPSLQLFAKNSGCNTIDSFAIFKLLREQKDNF